MGTSKAKLSGVLSSISFKIKI